VWRQKQLEYTFRLTAMQQYEDFEQVTDRALEYALAVVGGDLSSDQRRAALGLYDDLELFPEVADGLRRLHAAGHQLVVLSNGSPRMIETAVRSAGLDTWFAELISVDEVRAYKPSPLVYRHAAERLGRPIGDVRLISSNPFDVLGAAATGMRVAWLDRSHGLFDTLGPPPAMVVSSLIELAERLAAARPEEVVLEFNAAINRQDLDRLARLMTDDHEFVDSAGNVEQGRTRMTEGWRGFFTAYPDYRNTFMRVSARGDEVTVIGFSTCSTPELDGPALWRATVAGDRVARWQVLVDTPDHRAELGIDQ
jgi:2-haloacid dehalogenase